MGFVVASNNKNHSAYIHLNIKISISGLTDLSIILHYDPFMGPVVHEVGHDWKKIR